MYSRQTPAQKAEIERKNAESAARMAKMQAEREQAKLHQEAQDAERAAFEARVKATRTAFANGQPLPDHAQPLTAKALYATKAAEEQKAREAAEAARRAALTPLDIWKSTLPYQEQKRVEKWESINGMPYPMELR